MREITGASNWRLKELIHLRDSRTRRAKRLFLIDGVREISRAIRSGIEVEQFFLTEKFFEKLSAVATEVGGNELLFLQEHLRKNEHSCWLLSPALLDKVAFGARNESIVALARAKEFTFEAFEQSLCDRPVIAVIEGVEKPGNIGAIYRSADGAGIAGILPAASGTDFYNPNTIRASLGTIFRIPTMTASGEEIIRWLNDRRFQIAVAVCDGAAPYHSIDYRVPTAIVLGNEATGLTGLWRAEQFPNCKFTAIKLPMLGIADSLNVSATAAVLFYEARRQRTG